MATEITEHDMSAKIVKDVTDSEPIIKVNGDTNASNQVESEEKDCVEDGNVEMKDAHIDVKAVPKPIVAHDHQDKEKESHEHKETESHEHHKEKDSHDHHKEKESHEHHKEKESHEHHKEKESHEHHKEKESHEHHKEKESHDNHKEKELSEDHKEQEAHKDRKDDNIKEASHEKKKEGKETKKPMKRTKKTEEEEGAQSHEEKSEDEKESVDDEEHAPGLLEQSPVLEAGTKRSRKKVQRLSYAIDTAQAEQEEKRHSVPEGRGISLGQIEEISNNLKNIKPGDLKLIHSTAFGRPGNVHEVRVNLRKFKGFEFDKAAPAFAKKLASLKSRHMQDLKTSLRVLCLDTKGTRDEMAERLLDFLVEPNEESVKKPKRASTSGAKHRRSSGTKKQVTKSDEDDEQEDADEGGSSSKKMSHSKKPSKHDTDMSEDEDDANEDEGSEISEQEESPKKTPKKRKSASKPASAKATTPAKKRKSTASPRSAGTPAKKAKTTKTSKPSKTSKKKKAVASSDDESSDGSVEGSGKAKRLPSDEALKAKIRDLLKDADLETVTMKNVCEQVYNSFPDNDLTHKKEFIKKVVKEVLSSP